jgi:hypothetical protein
MAIARQAERVFPQAPRYPLAAVAAAVLVTAILAFFAIDPLMPQQPSVVSSGANPALVDAEGRWELQHKLQSGDVDPLTKAQREWERQRLQLGGAFR